MTKVHAILITTTVISAMSRFTEAAIIYVDAEHSTNTARADGSGTAFHTNNLGGTSTSAGDNLWDRRINLGNGLNGAIYESNGGPNGTQPTEDAPRLVTTISGLVAGEHYNIYAYLQSNVNNLDTDWRLRAGLENTVGDLPLFSGQGILGATAGTLITAGNLPQGAVLYSNAALGMFQLPLGAMVADTNGEVRVYIDDFANPSQNPPTTQAHWLRSRYDGVGYELVPEPCALVLGILGSVGLGCIPRRRQNF
jgi:hypothetical protein